VTGCTYGGIGFDTALILAQWNASVICTVRSKDIGEEVVVKTAPLLRGSKGKIEYALVELASFKSVRSLAAELSRRVSRLDGIVLNAGVNYHGSQVSEDGLETLVQVNHYSQFLLVRLLEGKLAESVRLGASPKLVFVSSTAYLSGYLDRELYEHTKRPQGRQDKPDFMGSNLPTYSDTKLMNVLTANKFGERFKSKQINGTSNSCSPGLVRTKMTSQISDDPMIKLSGVLSAYFGRTCAQGAARTIQILTEPPLEKISGHHFNDYIPLPRWFGRTILSIFS